MGAAYAQDKNTSARLVCVCVEGGGGGGEGWECLCGTLQYLTFTDDDSRVAIEMSVDQTFSLTGEIKIYSGTSL